MASGKNRQYNNGANFERRVKARLEEQGWTVFRTAGSHSPADLIAMRRVSTITINGYTKPILAANVRMYQCKGGSTTMGSKARREFAQFAIAHAAEPWIVERGIKLRRISPTGEYADNTGSEKG